MKYIRSLIAFLLLLYSYNGKSQEFNELTGFTIEGLKYGTVEWGDFDNDDDLDVLLIGLDEDEDQKCFIYENNNNGTFTQLPSPFSPTVSNTYPSRKRYAKWGDIDNDGYLDVVINPFTSFNTACLYVYKNNGDNTFTSRYQKAYMSYSASSAFDLGDIDSDGDLDIVLSNKDGSTILYNQGSFTFLEELDSEIPSSRYNAEVELGDYDLDGDLDMLMCGSYSSPSTRLYQNKGNGDFEYQDTVSFPSLNSGTVEWGDFNGDAYPDILMSGSYYLYVYKNNGDNTFTDINLMISADIRDGEASWGDIDNDGDLDITVCGSSMATCYLNNGDESFSFVTSIQDPGIRYADLALADYDNDNDLDVIIMGDSSSTPITKIFRNDTLPSNPVPDIPSNLSYVVSGKDVLLKWNPITSDNTDTLSLSYNVMVGTTSGSSDIIHPSANSSGLLRFAGLGNAQTDTTFLLRNLAKGTYYWKVQAIDNSYKGSAFSSESSFAYNVDCQTYNIVADNIGGSEAIISWIRGNGENCLAFIKKNAQDTALPVNNISYSASSEFGTGSEIGSSGWYCVYKGMMNSIHITGLDADSSYSIQVFEFDGTSGSEVYQTDISSQNNLSFNTGLFTDVQGLSLSAGNSQISQSFWVDIDNDDDLDLFIMAQGRHYLYRNQGNDVFSLITSPPTDYWTVDFGDFNNDGNVDMVLAGFDNIHFYSNDGTGIFTSIGISFSGFSYGSLDLGDYDSDGDLDLVITGEEGGSFLTVTKLFRNNGDETFTEIQNHGLEGLRYGDTDWADINNDGYLDIAISGITIDGDAISKAYINNTDESFTEIFEFNGGRGEVTWGDFDNDGDYDLMLLGQSSSRVFENDGSNSFDQVSIDNFYAVSSYGSGQCGDYNNDGYLDIMSNGFHSGYTAHGSIFMNDKNGGFQLDPRANLIAIGFSACAWGDYDNDGDLDIVWTGETGDEGLTKIYRNDIAVSNSDPAVPDNISNEVNKSQVTLRWGAVENDSTPPAGLTYNIRVGTISGGIDITSPNASNSGYRRLAEYGNAYSDTSYILTELPFDDYFWSVQAVDQGYAASSFSSEGTFSIVPVQVSNLSAQIINTSSLLMRWESGNGGRRVVFCKQTESGNAMPVDGTTYLPDEEFGYGEEIGSTGWFCVYNGRNDSTIVSGLVYNTNYSFHIIEYLGDIGSEEYFTEIVDGNPGIFSTGLFTEQTSITIDEQQQNEFAWGDYNNDGLTDVFIPGPTSRLMQNNGDNTFSEDNTTDFPDYRYGSSDWGDYDNDGDLDLAITGKMAIGNAPISAIYRNDGAGLFTDQTPVDLIDLMNSDIEWGDYNNDGFLDIVIIGATSNIDPVPTAKVYTNIDGTSFSEHTQSSFIGTFRGTAKWVDVDTDGDLDLHITGSLSDDPYWPGSSNIYKNDSGVFTNWTNILPDLYDARVDWGDYDHDGDLDVLMSRPGQTIAFANDGNANFEQIFSRGDGYSSNGDVCWADFDNDGYLDIFYGNYAAAAIIFKNIDGQSFEQFDDGSFKFTHVQNWEWCDYDNDGDIDILVCNWSGDINLYRNNLIMESGAFPINTPANSPTGLTSVRSPEGITLDWSPVENDETPSQSLSYNVRIGTSIDTFDITSPFSDDAGFYRMAKLGNASVDTTFVIDSLESGRYYWQVQAIDMAFKGGEWSKPDSFIVKNLQAFFEFTTVCQGHTTSFSDFSVSTDPIESWLWDFGDGNTSNDQNPYHIFSNSGNQSVKLVIEAAGVKDSTTVDVLVYPKPIPSFTADPVCQGLSTVFANTTDLNGTSILSWSWEFDNGENSTDENPDPVGYLNSGMYNVELIVNATNGCADSITQEVIVAEYPSATIAAGGNPQFCEGGNVKLFVPYDESYTYQWFIGGIGITDSDSSDYYALESGDYSVSVTNPLANCISTSPATATVAVAPTPSSPYISLTGETTFCEGDSVRLRISSTAGATYQWLLNGGAVGTSSNTYYAKSTGDYEVLVTNSSGCSSYSSNTVDLTVNSSPTIPTIGVAGSNVFCSGDSLLLNVTNNASLSYAWLKNDIVLADGNTNEFYAKESGEYTLQLENSNSCLVETEPVSITVDPSPDVPLISYSGSTTFCSGDSLVLASDEVAGVSYQWKLNLGNTGSNESTYTAKISGDYSLELSNSYDCTSSSDIVSIMVLSSPVIPTVSIIGSTEFCSNDSLELSVSEEAGIDYQWMDGASLLPGETQSTIYARVSGDYLLRLTNNDGCNSYTEAKEVQVSPSPPAPHISYTGSAEFCEGDSIILEATEVAGIDYQWKISLANVGSNQNTFTAKNSGNYTLELTNSFNCSSNSEILVVNVLESPAIPTVSIVGDTEFCSGDSIGLNVSSEAGISYQWMNDESQVPGETSNSFYAKSTGNFSLRLSNTNSCESFTDPVSILVNPSPLQPVITYSGSTTFCDGESLILSVSDIENNTFQWTLNGGAVGTDTSKYTAQNPGIYVVIASNSDGCQSQAIQEVDITVLSSPALPVISASGDRTFCEGASVELSVDEDASLQYQWKNNKLNLSGENTYTLTATSSGSYSVEVENTSGCIVSSAEESVSVKNTPDAPVIESSGPTEFCEGDMVILSISPRASTSYEWFLNNVFKGSGINYTAEEGGNYSVSATSSLTACSSTSANLNIVVNDVPDVPGISEQGNKIFCIGDSLVLSVVSSGSNSYQWLDNDIIINGATSNIYKVFEGGSYSVRTTNSSSCETTSEIIDVTVKPNPGDPIISATNYNENDCPSLDPVILSIGETEESVNLQWFLGFSPLSGETYYELEGHLEEGEYYVEAELDGCTLESDIFTISYKDVPAKPEIIAEGPTVWYLASSNDSAAAYKWFRNDVEISGANEYIYLANDQLGKYEVAIAEQLDGCFTISDPVRIPLGTGINEDPFSGLHIYPNPTPGKFTLEMENSLMGELIIDIFNEQGSKVLNVKIFKETSRFKTEIDLSGQPSALYLIGLTLDKYRVQKQLVVE